MCYVVVCVAVVVIVALVNVVVVLQLWRKMYRNRDAKFKKPSARETV